MAVYDSGRREELKTGRETTDRAAGRVGRARMERATVGWNILEAWWELQWGVDAGPESGLARKYVQQGEDEYVEGEKRAKGEREENRGRAGMKKERKRKTIIIALGAFGQLGMLKARAESDVSGSVYRQGI
jgi:hypothetical protein